MENLYKKDDKSVFKNGDVLIKSFGDSHKLSNIFNEALNQQRIYEAGVKCPEIYEVKKVDGHNSICMKNIKGTTLEKLINANKEDIDKYMDMFTDIHLSILSTSAYGLTNSYGKIKRKIMKSKLPATTQYNLFFMLRTIDFTRDIMHGDLDLSNVILGDDNIPYIIDWSHAAFGNKFFDIAVTYAVLNIKSQSDLAEIYLTKIIDKLKVEKDKVIDLLILAYIYVVDRYDETTQNKIYDKINQIIKTREA